MCASSLRIQIRIEALLTQCIHSILAVCGGSLEKMKKKWRSKRQLAVQRALETTRPDRRMTWLIHDLRSGAGGLVHAKLALWPFPKAPFPANLRARGGIGIDGGRLVCKAQRVTLDRLPAARSIRPSLFGCAARSGSRK